MARARRDRGGPSRPQGWPGGGGEMGALIHAHNWAATPLGPLECWPQSLRSAVDLVLACDFPMIVQCAACSASICMPTASSTLRSSTGRRS
jgi:hypothetical protein